jgi:hypothetical protein
MTGWLAITGTESPVFSPSLPLELAKISNNAIIMRVFLPI